MIFVCIKCPQLRWPRICAVDGKDIIEHGANNDCPKGYFVSAPVQVTVAPRIAGPEGTRGAWKRIHIAALFGDPAQFPAVVKAERNGLPCGECNRHTDEFIKANPIPDSTNEACWNWSYKFQDGISQRIGNERFPQAEARAFYTAVTTDP